MLLAKKKSVNQIEQVVKTAWWILLLRGVAFAILGILLLFRPIETTTLLIWVFGLYLLVDGIFSTIFSIAYHAKIKKWGILLIQGLLGIFVGLFALFRPVFFTTMAEISLLLLIGIALIVFGVMQVFATLEFKSWSMFISGIILILLGILYFARPALSAMLFIYIVGGLMLVGGLACIWYAFQLEQVAKRLEK